MITTESQPVTISPADWVLPFASGELSPAEVEALLLECEADHALSMHCLQAIVQHRQMVALLQGACMDSDSQSLTAKLPLAASESATMLMPSASPKARIGFDRLGLLTSLAAALLIGLWLGQPVPSSPKSSTAATDQQATVAHNDLGAHGTLVANQHSGVDLRSLLQPPSDSIDPEMAASLRSAGVMVEQEPIIFLIEGTKGERWAVPVQQSKLRYVSQ